MSGIAARNVDVAASQRAGKDERSGFDAVGNDAVLGAAQFADALHADGGSPRTFNLRAHFVEQVGQVADFGLAGTVLQYRLALGQGGGHKEIFRARDRNLVEHNLCALKPVGAGFDVAVLLGDARPQALQSLDMKIDRPSSNGAATREGDPSSAPTGDQ